MGAFVAAVGGEGDGGDLRVVEREAVLFQSGAVAGVAVFGGGLSDVADFFVTELDQVFDGADTGGVAVAEDLVVVGFDAVKSGVGYVVEVLFEEFQGGFVASAQNDHAVYVGVKDHAAGVGLVDVEGGERRFQDVVLFVCLGFHASCQGGEKGVICCVGGAGEQAGERVRVGFASCLSTFEILGGGIGGISGAPDDFPDTFPHFRAGGFGVCVVDYTGYRGDGDTCLLCDFF